MCCIMYTVDVSDFKPLYKLALCSRRQRTMLRLWIMPYVHKLAQQYLASKDLEMRLSLLHPTQCIIAVSWDL